MKYMGSGGDLLYNTLVKEEKSKKGGERLNQGNKISVLWGDGCTGFHGAVLSFFWYMSEIFHNEKLKIEM